MNTDEADYSIRQGETPGQLLSASIAHAGDLSLWHVLQELGIFRASVLAGDRKRKVWLRTFTSPIVWAIWGM